MASATPRATLRAAIIGYGMAGNVFHAPLIASTPGMTVAGIITGNAARQSQAHQDYPTAQILPSAEALWQADGQFDFVVVATPNRFHGPLGEAAMRQGLPVVIDKPLASSAQEAEQLIATSIATGMPLTCFQNRRWDGDFLTVQQVVRQGLLGQIVRYESRFERFRPVPHEGAWREHSAPEDGGGLLFDLGSHLIDQSLQLFGTPKSVYAELPQRRSGVQVDDDSFVALHYDDLTVHLWMSVLARIAGPRYSIRGIRGAYEKFGLDLQEAALIAGQRPGDDDWGKEPSERWGTLLTDIDGLTYDGTIETLPGAYECFYSRFRDALNGNAALPVDPRDSLLGLRIITAAQQSAAAQQIVPFTG